MKIKTLKSKIVLSITGLILFFGFLSTIFTFFYTKNIMINNAEKNLLINTLGQSEELSAIFDNSRNLIKTLSEVDEIEGYLKNNKDFSEEHIVEHLEGYNIADRYSAVYLMDRNGETLISTEPSFVGNNYSFRDYFGEAMEGDSWVDVVVGVTSGQPGYYFSHVVKDKNFNRLGVVVAKMKPEVIHEAFHLNQSNNDLHIMFVDEYGVIIYSDREDRIYKSLGEISEEKQVEIKDKKRFASIEIEALDYGVVLNRLFSTESQQVFEIYDKDDPEEEIISITKIKDLNFFIITEEETDNYVKSALQAAIFISLFVLLAAVVTIFVILYSMGKLLEPLSELKNAINIIAKGNLDHQVKIKTGDEFEELGEAYNLMTAKLKTSSENIEGKIKERTTQLEQLNSSMVGRELKMIELKKEIMKLKNKSGDN